MVCIYSITNTVNGKRYVGSSVSSYKRFATHKSALKMNAHHNTHLQRAWNKYGQNTFVFAVIEECDDAVRYQREQFWMDTLNTTSQQYGYNIRPQADGHRLSDETKAKLSAVRKGVPVFNRRGKKNVNPMPPSWFATRKEQTAKRWQDPEYRQRMCEMSQRLAKDPDYLRKQSETHRARWTDDMRKAEAERSTARQSDPDYRKRMSERCKGIPKSEETKARMRAARRLRAPISEETRGLGFS